MQKTVIIGGLCFITVGSGLIDFQILDTQKNILPELREKQDRTENRQPNNSENLNSTNILGDRRKINVPSKDLNFSITGSGESRQSDYRFQPRSETFRFSSSNSQNKENMRLVREYSIAIKDLQ